MASRRREIANLVVDNLKLINGQVSTFDPSYTYLNNIFNNAFRKLKFIDEINDFPSIYSQAGVEDRTYHSDQLIEAELEMIIRCYVRTENAQNALENLIQDVEHVVYHIPSNPSLGIQDIIIDSISTDEGLIEPYGIAEINILATYVLDD